MVAEGELRSHIDDSEKVRELQEKLAEMKSEVCIIWYQLASCYNAAPIYSIVLNLTYFITKDC